MAEANSSSAIKASKDVRQMGQTESKYEKCKGDESQHGKE